MTAGPQPVRVARPENGNRAARGLVTSPLAAVVAGLSAHAVAAGCPPDASRTVLVLPWMLLAVHGLHRLSRQRSSLARAAAGQAVVHLALALTSPCAPHGASAPAGHAGAVSAAEALMTAVHLVAVVACVTVLERTERALGRAAAGCIARVRQQLAPRVTRLRLEDCRPPVPEGQGPRAPARRFVGCGGTRGPPAYTARLAFA